jgi:hypothetical protein
MNNKVLIGTIAVAIILISGFLMWRSSSPVKESTPAINNIVSKISSDTQQALAQLETAKLASVPTGWESYFLKTTNSDLTFKHPTSVIFKKLDASSNSEGGVSIYYDTAYTRAFVAGGGGEAPLGMYISVLNSSLKVEDVMATPIGDAQATQDNHATTSLFGEKAYILSGQGMDRYDIILFSHNNRLYQVTIQYGMPSDEMRSTFYKVLASIEFSK